MDQPMDIGGLSHTTAFDRGSMALRHTVRGDFGAAARAMVAPRSLSPHERKTLADDIGIGQGNSAYDFLLRTITNPMAIAGVVLATRFPIPRAREMFEYSDRLLKSMGPFLKRLGSVDDLYRGTDIPELYKKILREVEDFRRSHAERIGTAILKAEKAGLRFDRKAEILLSAKLDGLDTGKRAIFQKPISMGPAFDTLVSDVRVVLDDVWEQNFGTVLKQQKLSKAAMRRITGQLKAQYVWNADEIKRFTTYFPHRVTKDLQQWERQTEAMIQAAGGRQSVYAEQAARGAEAVSTQHALPRKFLMIPDPEELVIVRDMLKPGTYETLVHRSQKLVDRTGPDGLTRLKMPLPRYSLRFLDTMSSYLHGMARAWGWSIADGKVVADTGSGTKKWQGMGERLVQSVERFGAEVDPVRAAWMKDSYIPIGLGRLTFRQALNASEWNQYKIQLAGKLETGKLGQWLGSTTEGAQVRKWMQDTLKQDRGILSLHNLGGRTAGYLYLSALGANPVSAGYNLLQTLLTTVPTIGPGYTLKGIGRTLEEAPKYFKGRAAGLTHAQALSKAFPHYVAEGLAGTPVSEEAIGRALASSWETSLSLPTKASDVASRVKSAMMAMFSTTENFNRLVAFEGAFAKATAEGLRGAEATTFARRVTETTQFVGGPAGTPAFAREWPALARQFLNFTARAASFQMGPGLGLGSRADAIADTIPLLHGLNPGTLGRSMLTSAVTYEAGRSFLDADLSRGLVFGVLPIPNPRAPFSPFPFVPPVLSIGGAVGQDLLTGKMEQTPFVLPLLMPGGIALSRLSTAVAPEAAKALGKDYADYEHPNPQGLIPLYTPEGSLRGYFTPLQIWARALGVSGATAELQERELESYLLAQRDRIRSYRKSYLDAIVGGEAEKADEVRREYDSVYPGMGGLTFTTNDLRAVYLRESVPRLERMLATMPKEVRPSFSQLVTMTLGGEAQNLLGVDPMLLQAPMSSVQRDPWRETPPENTMEAIQRRTELLQTSLPGGPGSGNQFMFPQPGGPRGTPRTLDSFSGTTPSFLNFQGF